MKSIFSVDVEDWFHILDVPSTPELSAWDGLPSHVEKNFHKMLDVFDEERAKVTCFFLGYVAKRFPGLVREAVARGHEVASHGFAHRLVYTQTPAEFLEDARSARLIIEEAAGRPVHGYRSSGFSVTSDTPWFFEKVLEAGYTYDSSVFPAKRGHGGMESGERAPHPLTGNAAGLFEFPITVAEVLGKPMCFFGGGYLRLFPYPLIKAMSRKVLAEGRPVTFYVHPREIDPHHPRLPMPAKRRFRTYVNLRTTERKIRHILRDFETTTFQDWLQASGSGLQTETRRHEPAARSPEP
jgi:polysaccharide deacetylase family protein (PEP-CTERM system associated)